MLRGNLLTPDGWRYGTLQFDGERIRAITAEPVDPAHNDAHYLLPGFIDLHIHGALGHDFMEGAAAASAVAGLHARSGTTSLLATTVGADHATLTAVLGALGQLCRERPTNSARLIGIHLEGPYVNPGRLGGLPDTVRPVDLAEIDGYRQLAPIAVITLSPEYAGNAELIAELARRGIRVQVGHSLGSYEDGVAALDHGAAGFTHLYNAMTPLAHRAPGMVGAALAHAEYSELIPDLIHVHPGAMKVALRCIPRLYCVTDATQTAGLPDGSYPIHGRTLSKCLGAVTLPDGTLAGSALTMDLALRNLVQLGLTLEDASHRVSRNPADYLGRSDIGRLVPGARGDVVELDRDLNVVAVHIDGAPLPR